MARGFKTGGGSRKGVPNKHPRGFRERLRAYCVTRGVDPHEFMVDLLVNQEVVTLGVDADGQPITGPAVPIAIKFQAAKELASYLEPKMRTIELTGDAARPLTVTVKLTLTQALERAYGIEQAIRNGQPRPPRLLPSA